ncbi:MAG: septal ring lytic transglycosylase RlpA family protein [Bacteroidia bacterium]|nr:septal ring lytic transglycosylase RlpA family protein [Bacteroidia bacterium]MCX7764129.1 septal ring lytic transglycosylase RlpA family protein [Bacteroidia bacterium]MDW8057556.1 septal ring lytic transglycosylase RlpA family protein [Bacteroidia bacterium]
MRAWGIFVIAAAKLAAQEGFVEEGEASYYAPSFHGRRTASGEPYNRMGMTAAHRTLPFDTYVRVTDKATGRSVVVRINDRGPHKPERIIDLSERAAQELGIIARGVAQVRIEVISPPKNSPSISPSKSPFYRINGAAFHPLNFGVQIGSFSEESNAHVLARNAEKEYKEAVFIWKAATKGRVIYRVIVGSFAKREEAEKLRERLRRNGWQAVVVELTG